MQPEYLAKLTAELQKPSYMDMVNFHLLNPQIAQELKQKEEAETAKEEVKNEPQEEKKPEMTEDKVREVMREEFANMTQEQTSKEETKDVGLMAKILNRFKNGKES